MTGMHYIIINITAFIIMAVLAVTVSLKGGAIGRRYYIWLSVSIAWWCAFAAMEVINSEIRVKLIVGVLQYLGVVAVPVLWLLFCVVYTHKERWLKNPWWVCIWIMPFLTVCIAATNSWHRLLWTDITVKSSLGGWIGIYTPGPWAIINLVWGYSLMVAGVVLIGKSASNTNVLYKKQALGLVVALVPPWFFNGVHFLDQRLFNSLDLTPAAFAISGIIILNHIRRYQLFEVSPITPAQIMDSLDIGLIALNPEGLVTERNRAALSMLGIEGDVYGLGLKEVLGSWPEIMDEIQSGQKVIEVSGGKQQWLKIKYMKLRGEFGSNLGKLMSIQDITEMRQMEENLRKLAVTDVQTGLLNRRAFNDVADKSICQAVRHQRPLSLMLLDLDHFKNINDHYGHPVGDQTLSVFVEAVNPALRKSDIFARVGGEEFAILLPETALDGARITADRILKTVRETMVHLNDGRQLHFTVSIGIAELGQGLTTLEELMRQSDKALYKAKVNGRDAMAVYTAEDFEEAYE